MMNDKLQDQIQLARHFALWLRTLRKRLELTQAELGDLIGVRGEPISRWENEREMAHAHSVIKLMALATSEESEALIDKGASTLDDLLKVDRGSHLEVLQCADCGRTLRVRDFTNRGWPAPRLIRKPTDPYSVKVCPVCVIPTIPQS